MERALDVEAAVGCDVQSATVLREVLQRTQLVQVEISPYNSVGVVWMGEERVRSVLLLQQHDCPGSTARAAAELRGLRLVVPATPL